MILIRPDMAILKTAPNSYNFYTSLFGLVVLLLAWIIVKKKYDGQVGSEVGRIDKASPFLQTRYPNEGL